MAPAEAHRVSRVLATARAFLATCGLVAIYLDPTEPTRYAAIAYGLLTVYAAHSLALMLWLCLRQESSPPFRLIVHSADIFFAAAITLFTEGANSPLFVFFFFVLLAAAYRWGLRETLATAAAAIVVLLLEAALLAPRRFQLVEFYHEPIEPNRLITRAAYLLLTGLLLGYLAEEEKQLRAETSVLARVLSKAQSAASLRANLQAVLSELLRLFDAPQALLAVREVAAERLFLWEVRRPQESPETLLTLREPDEDRRETYFFAASWGAWYISEPRASEGRTHDVLALDAEGRRLRPTSLRLPPSFAALHPFRSLVGTGVNFGQEWAGQLILIDPGVGPSPEVELRFLQTLVRQIGPALYSSYLLRRLRARAGALERARVAHELHDGVIQSLIALEMQVDVLRRQAGAESGAMAEEIGRLQRLLHQEVLNVRELMLQMKPMELDPQRLLEFLSETVDRFQRDTGIAARFVSELEEVRLPPRICRELARIVQEALVNVRKHSGARNVLVRFGAHNGQWQLVVDDDGGGFPFAGRLSQAELDAGRRGPLVIKERVRNIGGELAIESSPGRGSRLEITLPEKIRV